MRTLLAHWLSLIGNQVFVWDAKDGRLDLYLSGDSKAVEPLQAIIAEAILGCDELPEDPADNRVYNLFPLRRKNFSFTWDPRSNPPGAGPE